MCKKLQKNVYKKKINIKLILFFIIDINTKQI